MLLLCLAATQAFSQPVIGGFSPASGLPGSSVIISGTGFSATPANNIVYFGAVRGTVTVSSVTSVTATVPASASHQPISVTVNGLTGYSTKPFITTFVSGGNIGLASFGSKLDIHNIVEIAGGDFDGDGKIDLAASYAGSYNASLAFFRNNGTPGHDSLTPGTIFANAASDYLGLGDFDGDGKLDLATLAGSDNLLKIYKNNSTPGNIIFAKVGPDYPTDYSPAAIAIGDLNADGKPDIAIVNRGGSTMCIFINTTSAAGISFAPKLSFPLPQTPTGIAIADFNGDGKPDIATANNTGSSVSIFPNAATGGVFSLGNRVDLAVAGGPEGLAVGDVDGDGKADIVTANYYTSTISILRNKIIPGATITMAGFDPSANYGAGQHPYQPCLADFDGDGKLDIAVDNLNDNNVSVFKNNSTPGIAFTPASLGARTDFATGTGPITVHAFDMDGDGKQDILSSNLYSLTVSILRNLIYGLSATISGPQTICVNAAPASVTFSCLKGVAPFTFTYSINGGANQTVSTIAGNSVSVAAPTNAAGTFTYNLVSVADNNGVTQQVQSASAAVTVYTTTASAVAAMPACNGGANGMVTLSGTNGTGPYKYKMLGAATYQTTGVFKNLAQGDYIFTVKDASGCTGNVPVTINEPPLLTAGLTAGTVCFASNTVLTATATGGTGAYQYALNNGAKQSSNIFNGQPATGNYTVTVTDAKACTATSLLTITPPASALSGTATITNVDCFGNATGSVTITASGSYAQAPYLYAQSASSPFQSTGQFTGLPAGTYNFLVKDSGGCTAHVSAVISQPAVLTAALAAGKLCKDSNTTFTATAGGGTGPYMYKLNGGAQQSTGTFNNYPGAGNYILSVVDTKGCTATSILNIKAPMSSLSASLTVINDSCYGYTDGSITAKGAGGYPPYQYKLTGYPVYSSNGTISHLSSAGYGINVRDSAGCVVTVSTVVQQPAMLSVSVAKGPLCYGATTTFTATGTGGTMPYQYTLNNNAPQASNVFSGQPSSGNFKVAISDVNGCKGVINTFTIKPPKAALKASVLVTNSPCYGQEGAITVKASGGYPTYLYQVFGVSAYQANNVFSNLVPGAKVVTVKDSGGCIVTINTAVTQPNPLTATLTSTGLCFGATTTLNVKATGGTTPYQYHINTGPYQSSSQFINEPAGTYTAGVKDANNCFVFAPQLILKAPTAALSATVVVVKTTTPAAANGKVTITAKGGVAPYQFRKGFDPLQSSNVYTGLPVAAYTFTVQDANGCTIVLKVAMKSATSLQDDGGEVAGTEEESGKQAYINAPFSLKAFPNPSRSNFTVMLQDGDTKAPVEIRVMDMYGKEVYHTTGSVLQAYTFGETFINGMYIVQIVNGRQVQTVKLVKVK